MHCTDGKRCAVVTDEQLPVYKNQPDRSVVSSSCGKTALSVNSVNSDPSESGGAYRSYDVGSDGRKSEVGGAEAMHQPPHHAADPLDAYSLKSYSTTSQLSTAAGKYDYLSLSVLLP